MSHNQSNLNGFYKSKTKDMGSIFSSLINLFTICKSDYAHPCEIEVCWTELNMHFECTLNLISIFIKTCHLLY